MADDSKNELLLGGGIRHVRATLQYHAHSKQVPACITVMLFKRVNFPQNFVCLWNVEVVVS